MTTPQADSLLGKAHGHCSQIRTLTLTASQATATHVVRLESHSSSIFFVSLTHSLPCKITHFPSLSTKFLSMIINKRSSDSNLSFLRPIVYYVTVKLNRTQHHEKNLTYGCQGERNSGQEVANHACVSKTARATGFLFTIHFFNTREFDGVLDTDRCRIMHRQRTMHSLQQQFVSLYCRQHTDSRVHIYIQTAKTTYRC
jgi:hypothetical protein